MGTTETDSGSTNELPNLEVLDDTLDRKLPVMTHYKYLAEECKQGKKIEANFITEKNTDETVDNIDSQCSHKKVDTCTKFSFKFDDDGSDILKDFTNPFEETEEEKENNEEITRDKYTNISPFKTPLKKTTARFTRGMKGQQTSQISPETAAERFRELKEMQAQHVGFLYDSFDASNAAVVIDLRKTEEEYVGNNSVDDSSIQLNLLPATVRYNKEEDTQENSEATQADGNIHEQANKLLKDQAFTRHVEPNDTTNNDDVIIDAFELEKLETKLLLSDDLTNDLAEVKKTEYITNTDNISQNKEDAFSQKGNNLIVKNKTKIAASCTNQTPDMDKYEPSQMVESVDNANVEKVIDSANLSSASFNNRKTIDMETSRQHQCDKHPASVQETQLIDNFSQSIVLDEEEEEAEIEKSGDETKLHEGEYDNDDSDERIRTGPNIFQTFRIEEESQSQLENSNSQLQPSLPENKGTGDQVQIQGSEGNYSFGIPDTQAFSLPETYKINNDQHEEVSDLIIGQASSPVLDLNVALPENENENDNDNDNEDENDDTNPNKNTNTNVNDTEPEIPNTSAMSASKIYMDQNTAHEEQQADSGVTSTPINNRLKNKNKKKNKNKNAVFKKSPFTMQERLSHALEESELNSNCINFEVERNKKDKTYNIKDILDTTSVFILMDTRKIPARILKVFKSEKAFRLDVKTIEGTFNIDHSKVYAPICFNIGDQLKYIFDKRSMYVVTGLQKITNHKQSDVSTGSDYIGIETIDGYDTLYIKKKETAKNTQCETYKEFAVNLGDIYLTQFMKYDSQYKLFNDEDDFEIYLSNQVIKCELNEKSNDANFENVNLGKNLNALLPISRTPSFIKNNKEGYFSKCLFVFTGINSTIEGSRSNSKHGTPRHQRDKGAIQNLVTFIQSQGGTVLQEVGFEDIIKFKLKEKIPYRESIRGNGVSISPRKLKLYNNEIILGSNKHGYACDFRNFECVENKEGYYISTFKNDDSIDMIEDIKNFEFGCVISTRHVRTLKYLECLCLKWPIIHINFIKKCFEDETFLKNWRAEWNRFLLISGECSFLQTSIGLDIIDYYNIWKSGKTLSNQLRLNKLFKGYKVIIIGYDVQFFKEKIVKVAEVSNKRRKLNKPKRIKASDNYELENRDGSKSEEESDDDDDDYSCDNEVLNDHLSQKKGSDGNIKEETLLWIFRQLGFDEVVIVEKSCNLRKILKLDSSDEITEGALLKSRKNKGKPRKKSTGQYTTKEQQPKVVENTDTNKPTYIYFKHGMEIEQFRKLLANEKDDCIYLDKLIDWEWIVQRIICNFL